MPAGTVLLVSSRGLVSSAIRVVTRSHWSHSAIADGRGQIIEALGSGVRHSPETRYDSVSHYWQSVPGLDGEKAVAAAQMLIGEPYNYPAIAVFGLVTFGIPHQAAARWANRRDAFICSEVVAIALRAGGVDPWPHRLGSTISPGTIDITGSESTWPRMKPEGT